MDNKMYLDMVGLKEKGAIGIAVNDGEEGGQIELLPAGSVVYSMCPSERKDKRYAEITEKFGIEFYFSDNEPELDFYTVPMTEIFAGDSGGYYALLWESLHGEDNFDNPVYYINSDKKLFKLGESMSDFIASLKNVREKINNGKPYSGAMVFNSFAGAKKRLNFYDAASLFE